MKSFNEAISIALENVTEHFKGASDIQLEEALISKDKKLYEITCSFLMERHSFNNINDITKFKNNHLKNLANILGTRREYKVFLIDAQNGDFRGFRKYKEQ